MKTKIIATCIYFIVFLFICSCSWLLEKFGLFEIFPIVFTLLTPLKGTDISIYFSYVFWAVLPAICCAMILLYFGNKYGHKITISISVLGFIIFLFIALSKFFSLPCNKGYLLPSSLFYETHYVDPKTVDITFDVANLPNVLIISLESLENVYANESIMGKNLIPNLTKLQKENLSFSNYDSLEGTNFTLSSMVQVMCGVPLSYIEQGGKGLNSFLPNLICLPQILSKYGYSSTYLTPYDIGFGGTDKFVLSHSFDFLDLHYWRKTYDVTKGRVHWGLNDATFFRVAKPELIKLKQSKQPYMAFMLTTDTHGPKGANNPSCKSKEFGDIVSCHDKIVYDFITWYRELDPDGVIVLYGDHRAWNPLIKTLPVRSVAPSLVNVFINPQNVHEVERNRKLAAFDFLPTIIEAMGGKVEGRRLGLGVSLFDSEQRTLAEQMNGETLSREIVRRSKVYDGFIGLNDN